MPRPARLWAAGLFGLAFACGPAVPVIERSGAGADAGADADSSVAATSPRSDAPADVAAACDGVRGAPLGEFDDLPADLRVAVWIDLEAAELEPALARLEAWASAEASADLPIVAGLALSQVGFQLAMIRGLLGDLGFAPPAVLLLQGPGGESLWIWRIPCDVDRLRALVEARWSLRTRTLVGGVIGEPRDPAAFAFDLLLLPGERLALVPAGRGLGLLRWLRGEARGAARLAGGGDDEDPPGALLGGLEAAPLRVLIANRVAGGFALTPDGAAAERLLARVLADRVVIDGSLPPSP